MTSEDGSPSHSPAVAVDALGEFHVVWVDERTGNPDIFYLRVTPSGLISVGPINISETSGSSTIPDVAVDGGRNAHICWREGSSILLSRVNLDGLEYLDNLTVASGSSDWPAIATTTSGESWIAYQRQQVYLFRIHIAKITAAGSLSCTNVAADDAIIEIPNYVSLSCNASDQALLSYVDIWNFQEYAAVQVWIDACAGYGNFCSGTSHSEFFYSDNLQNLSIATPLANTFYLVFDDVQATSRKVYTLTDCFQVVELSDTPGPSLDPSLAAPNGIGCAYVAWEDHATSPSEIRIRKEDCSEPSILVSSTPGASTAPDLAVLDFDSWAAVWANDRSGTWEIFMSAPEDLPDIATGFQFSTDNYSFSNNQAFIDQHFRPLEMLIEDPEARFLTRCGAALEFMHGFFSWGGNCFGMSNTATDYYLNPAGIPIPGKTTYQLTTSEATPGILSAQSDQWRQSLLAAVEAWFDIPSISDPSTFSTITNRLTGDEPVPLVLLQKPDWYRLIDEIHMVVAWAREDLPSERRIRIYDVNYPDDTSRSLRFSSDDVFLGYGDYNRIKVIPEIATIPQLVSTVTDWVADYLHWLLTEGLNVFSLGSPGNALIIDNFGRRIGYSQEGFVNEIPGAEIAAVLSNQVYYLPSDLQYSAVVTGSDTGEARISVGLGRADDQALHSGVFDGIQMSLGSHALLKFSSLGFDSLLVDADGDSVYESQLQPDIDTVMTLIPPAPPYDLALSDLASPQIDLVWIDAASTELGYCVERTTPDIQAYRVLAVLPPNSTTYRDTTVGSVGEYYYRIAAFNAGGKSDFASDSILVIVAVPGASCAEEIPGVKLSANRPNPFNPETALVYTLSEGAPVDMAVYDVAGRVIRVLVSGYRQAGEHRVIWDGSNSDGRRVAAGVYFCRLHVSNQVLIQKLVVVR